MKRRQRAAIYFNWLVVLIFQRATLVTSIIPGAFEHRLVGGGFEVAAGARSRGRMGQRLPWRGQGSTPSVSL